MAIQVGDVVISYTLQVGGIVKDIKSCPANFCDKRELTVDRADSPVLNYYHEYHFTVLTKKYPGTYKAVRLEWLFYFQGVRPTEMCVIKSRKEYRMGDNGYWRVVE